MKTLGKSEDFMAGIAEVISIIISSGEEPAVPAVRSLLAAALTKKLAVIRMPRPLWPVDPKINPHTVDLFWLAIFLEDQEAVRILEGVVGMEKGEGRGQKGAVEITSGFAEAAAGLLAAVVPGALRQRLAAFVAWVAKTGGTSTL